MRIIRPYLETDASVCADVINLASEHEDGMNDAARSFLRAKNTPSGIHRELGAAYTLVAEEDGQVCGVGCLGAEEIKRLYVLPTVQRRGIGRALVAGLEEQARRRGLAVLRLGAAPASVGFYLGLGFIDDGPAELVRGDAIFHYFHMHKELTG
jgi:GNAT superfamily N-acetyltransferase